MAEQQWLGNKCHKNIRKSLTSVIKKLYRSTHVSNLLLTGKEIKRELESGYMYICMPAGVNREDLGKMFPEMKCWAVEEGDQIVDLISNSGEKQLEEIFKGQERQGDSLSTYIIKGSTWSKLLNCRYQGRVPKAHFRPDGSLEVNLLLNTHPLANVGGGSVKWIQA